VSARRRQPSLVFPAHRELADNPLSSLEIAVQHIDRQRLPGRDRRADGLEGLARRITQGTLPETAVTPMTM
jgi:hypothetical protein